MFSIVCTFLDPNALLNTTLSSLLHCCIGNKKFSRIQDCFRRQLNFFFRLFLPFFQYLTISYGLNLMMEQWDSKYVVINDILYQIKDSEISFFLKGLFCSLDTKMLCHLSPLCAIWDDNQKMTSYDNSCKVSHHNCSRDNPHIYNDDF